MAGLLWRNKATGATGGILLLKIAKKSAVWLENVRNVNGKDFLQNFVADGAGGKYFSLSGNGLPGQKCARKQF